MKKKSIARQETGMSAHSRTPSAVRTFARIVPPVIALSVAYSRAIRPWMLRWGATDEEVAAALPGDELLAAPLATATRAISIAASPADVWPWLVQLGQGRGGLYSYDRLENMAGCDIHNADHILPEFQHLFVGDEIRLVPPDYAVPLHFEVVLLEPERALVLRGKGDREHALEAGLPYPTWAFVLRPEGTSGSRLIVRWRSEFATTRSSLFWNKYGIEPVHFLMERKMMLGIKARAEQTALDREQQPIVMPV